ncbi:M23 family metallopeptidase [Granulosicoccus antarcticus]|nr:M23 family metallopeptidase [Granulosicoccus antarcticus]
MKKNSPLFGVGRMPFKLRLRLARFALWRLKHGRATTQTILLVCLVGGSAAVGYMAANQANWQASPVATVATTPRLASAMDSGNAMESIQQRVMAAELGKLQAEVMRLRVMFLRLAELAELNDGEFDLDMMFKPALDDQEERESSNEMRDRLFPGQASLLARAEEPVISEALPLVKQALVHISEQSARMLSVFRERRESFDIRVSGLPVVNGRVSSRYGYRVDPLSGRRQLHAGLDLASRPGSKIMALADGIVTYSGKNGGYGNLVELEHADGFRTRYAHNSQLLVPLGGLVKKGQSIATMGSTGRSTGTHVHVEVRHNGLTVDPQLYIR